MVKTLLTDSPQYGWARKDKADTLRELWQENAIGAAHYGSPPVSDNEKIVAEKPVYKAVFVTITQMHERR